VSTTTTLNSLGLASSDTASPIVRADVRAWWERRSGVVGRIRRPDAVWRESVQALSAQRASVRPQDVLVTAHRGGSLAAPESTLRAFRSALTAGADILELDVQLTSDGHVVVTHESRVETTTNGSGSVSEMTLAQLQKLNAGHWFVESRGTVHGAPKDEYHLRLPAGSAVPEDLQIVTLDRVFQEFPGTTFWIDLVAAKRAPELQRRVAELLDKHDAQDNVIVSSLDHSGIAWLQANRPWIKLSPPALTILRMGAQVYLRKGGSNNYSAIVDSYDVIALPYRFGAIREADTRADKWLRRLGMSHDRWVINRDVMTAARMAGKPVHAWTVNNPAHMAELMRLGVRSVTTDNPALAIAVRQQLAQVSTPVAACASAAETPVVSAPSTPLLGAIERGLQQLQEQWHRGMEGAAAEDSVSLAL
jgi:glycerophosphoryl diester phosphodiesterase